MKKNLLLVAGLGVLVVAIGIGIFFNNNSANASLAMTELEVQKMTCGSCVATITEALQQQTGVHRVAVSVTTGRSQVTFDPAEINAKSIAAVVTESGFPAAVINQLSTEEYQLLLTETEQLSATYVAKIGNRLLARTDFEAHLDQRLAAAGVQDAPSVRAQAISQLWPELKQRLLLLDAAAKNNVIVQNGEVELRIRQLQQQRPDLESLVQTRFGSMENFYRQLKEDMIINRNIEEHVLVGLKESKQRQARLTQWFQELLRTSPVIIYDSQLKQTSNAAGAGCGGGCCSKS